MRASVVFPEICLSAEKKCGDLDGVSEGPYYPKANAWIGYHHVFETIEECILLQTLVFMTEAAKFDIIFYKDFLSSNLRRSIPFGETAIVLEFCNHTFFWMRGYDVISGSVPEGK